MLSGRNFLAPSLPLSFSSSFLMQIQKRLFLFLFLLFCFLIFSSSFPSVSPLYSVISHFAPYPPTTSSSVCFRQTSPCQSVVAMCRSGTSPRETVGLTTWRSASAGDAVCPGLMSSWRYGKETATHSYIHSSQLTKIQ